MLSIHRILSGEGEEQGGEGRGGEGKVHLYRERVSNAHV